MVTINQHQQAGLGTAGAEVPRAAPRDGGQLWSEATTRAGRPSRSSYPKEDGDP
jgi:hypothetical protein